MEKLMTIKSSDDVLELMKEIHENVHGQVATYVKDKSTTRLLVTGVVTLSTIYIIKSYIRVLMIRRRSGLKGPMPLPLLGNFHKFIFGNISEVQRNICKNYGKTNIWFEGTTPVIQTADPELIKAITIKDFRYFMSRRNFGTESLEYLRDMLSTLYGDAWKNVRSILTTGFTAGKLKPMTHQIKGMSDVFCKYIDGLIEKNEPLNTKKFQNFAADVVCSNFFGVDVDTINNPDHPLPKAINKAFGSEFTSNWRFLVIFLFPKFAEFLMKNNMMSIFPAESIDYLSGLSNQIIEERRSKKTKRNDFIQLMVDHTEFESDEAAEEDKEQVEALKNAKKTLTNAQILSQSILFMMVGTDTTAIALTWVSHNLAIHPNIQDRLIQEIDDALERHDGKINYDSVNDIEYLNSVISETQRMYPVTFTDRQCTEDREINGIKFKAGDNVNMLLDALMNSEEINPNPEKFDPERERHNDTFLPFGSGPRVCIAQRFALLEIKTLLVTILKNYRFEKCEKTLVNPKTDNSGLCKPKDDILIKMVRR